MQEIIIELGVHCLDFGDWVPETLRDKYFQILTLIVQRGELNLDSLSLHEPAKYKPNIFKKKIDVAAAYQVLIYKVLEKCIKSLNLKGVQVYKRTFIEIALSMCFFHVP